MTTVAFEDDLVMFWRHNLGVLGLAFVTVDDRHRCQMVQRTCHEADPDQSPSALAENTIRKKRSLYEVFSWYRRIPQDTEGRNDRAAWPRIPSLWSGHSDWLDRRNESH